MHHTQIHPEHNRCLWIVLIVHLDSELELILLIGLGNVSVLPQCFILLQLDHQVHTPNIVEQSLQTLVQHEVVVGPELDELALSLAANMALDDVFHLLSEERNGSQPVGSGLTHSIRAVTPTHMVIDPEMEVAVCVVLNHQCHQEHLPVH